MEQSRLNPNAGCWTRNAISSPLPPPGLATQPPTIAGHALAAAAVETGERIPEVGGILGQLGHPDAVPRVDRRGVCHVAEPLDLRAEQHALGLHLSSPKR
jgi:hypothetical protein